MKTILELARENIIRHPDVSKMKPAETELANAEIFFDDVKEYLNLAVDAEIQKHTKVKTKFIQHAKEAAMKVTIHATNSLRLSIGDEQAKELIIQTQDQ